MRAGHTVGDNNQLSTDGIYNYTYDNEGNLVSRTKISDSTSEEYQWDHRNRLVGVTFKNGSGTMTKTVANEYDVFNRWVRRTEDPDGPGGASATDTFFAYDGYNPVLQFDDTEDDDLAHRNLFGPAVDQILAVEDVSSLTSAGNSLWALTDHLGTPRDIADLNEGSGTTTVTNHRTYNSFNTQTSEINAAVDFIFGETGKMLDEDTGANWHVNRWLREGRWLSQDPSGFSGGDTNLQRFAANDPQDFIDPDGHKKKKPGERAADKGSLGGPKRTTPRAGALVLRGVGEGIERGRDSYIQGWRDHPVQNIWNHTGIAYLLKALTGLRESAKGVHAGLFGGRSPFHDEVTAEQAALGKAVKDFCEAPLDKQTATLTAAATEGLLDSAPEIAAGAGAMVAKGAVPNPGSAIARGAAAERAAAEALKDAGTTVPVPGRRPFGPGEPRARTPAPKDPPEIKRPLEPKPSPSDLPPFRGGRHGFTKGPVGDGRASHHMPADSINGLPRDKGPAIQMDPADHVRTASHGSQGLAGARHRARQNELIKKGRFGEAIQMDIDDVRAKFGNKYDGAIDEMVRCLDDWMRVGLREPNP